MIKLRENLLGVGAVALDLAALGLAFLAAYVVRDALLPELLPSRFAAPLFPLPFYLWTLTVMVPAWIGLRLAFRLYAASRLATFRRQMVDLAAVNAIGLGLVLGVAYLLKAHDISRAFLLLFTGLDVLCAGAARLVPRALLRRARSQGRALRQVVIVGTDPEAQELAELIRSNPAWGLALRGLVGEPMPGEATSVPRLGGLERLESILQSEVVDEVLIAGGDRRPGDFEEVFLLCEDLGIDARLVLGGFPHVIARTSVEDFQGRLLLTFSTQPTGLAALAVKRLFDLLAGVLLLALFAAPGALIALLIKLDTRGPVFFAQDRVGLHGRRFRMLKFRSMVVGAERGRNRLDDANEMAGPVFKMRSDPRVTFVGWFLRRTSLDELPQLLNVLRGDMSLVGPRPPLPSEVAHYRRWQRRRLSMKPGITCLWQVSGRNQVDFDEWMRLDLHYIDTWSLWLDLKILMRTIPAVLSGRGAS